MRYPKPSLAYCLLVVSGVISGAVWAEKSSLLLELVVNECRELGVIDIPDGNNALPQDMLDGQSKVEGYITDTRDYLDCLLASEKVIGDALTYEQKKDSITRYNLSIARMEGLVDSFNHQLRIYKRVNEQ